MHPRLITVLAITLVAVSVDAHAYKPPPKTSYEHEALQHALHLRRLHVDTRPKGKRLRKIHIVTLPVFSKRDRWLQFFNVFHWKTKEFIIEREVILRPGQMWDPERIKETERKLRDPIFTTLVVTAPIASPVAGTVDLLVVTRDMWSLRLNSNFEIQTDTATGNSVLSLLSLSLSENNVFGYRKQAALVFNMNLGNYRIGPLYIDKNIAGTRLTLTSRAAAIFGRRSDELEGSTSSTVFQYPFWSLATKWGGGLSVQHFDGVIRRFTGVNLLDFETPDGTLIPHQYRLRQINMEASGSRSVGKHVINRFSVGYRLSTTRPSLRDNFVGSAVDRQAFVDGVFPRSERVSAPFLRYSMFTPVYHRYRNVNSYDLAEDRRLGPEARLEVGLGAEVLGSDIDHVSLASTAGWSVAMGNDGFGSVAVGGFGRVQAGSLIDRRLNLSARLVAPMWFKLFRLVGRISYSGRFKESQNRFFQLGGESALRGYPIGAFAGLKLLVANVEARSRPWRVWFTRVGAVLFWDVGDATDRLSDLGLQNDVGVGVRMLFPQLSPLVYRFDLAFPLNGVNSGEPRFIASFGQVF